MCPPPRLSGHPLPLSTCLEVLSFSFLFSAALCLCCCVQDFSSWGARTLGVQGSLAVTQGLSSTVARGILVSGPGTKPLSPEWAGGFLTTEPPGKSHLCF